MTRVIPINDLHDARLWRRLDTLDRALAGNVETVCGEAADRMKAMPAYAPQYTLHDERHLLRTTELMAKVLGAQVDQLNRTELALLILAAFFHDQGMVPSGEEYAALRGEQALQLHADTWRVDHPNYGEISAQLGSQGVSEEERHRLAVLIAELDQAMLTDFLRGTHAERSGALVRERYGNDKRLETQGVNLAFFVARLCESHSLAAKDLRPESGFRFDERIGTEAVNMAYLGVALRLADILDFDRDRAPEPLLRSIHFTSDVSVAEWEKHRSVQGWVISPDLIQFTMRCKHPAYEASARRYMDWVDRELAACHDACRAQPAEFARYRLDLPVQVDRTRIEPEDQAYYYHDLEFGLSRDEVVRLLMMGELYVRPHLCIRELLQNSLDALRYRKALLASSELAWEDGTVEMRHFVNGDGYEVVECRDNGSGMDEDIIRGHFTKVGRSFYRSPEFERERARLAATGHDFDPCSLFGIGFMSCFMLGDRITVTTRRDYGPGRGYGHPLVVEINGLSGLLVVRPGSGDQPVGTTVSIVSRRRPSFLDSWTDQVHLVTVLKGYALATEFPITARCEIPELADNVSIPAVPEAPPTLLEMAGIATRITLEQGLSQVHPSLGGIVRESFLVDADGMLCIQNGEAGWRGARSGATSDWSLDIAGTSYEKTLKWRVHTSPVCADGILVAGDPGRPAYREQVAHRLGSRNSGIHLPSALIDARGDLKPELTPGRTPPERFVSDPPPGWDRLYDLCQRGVGLLWGQLAGFLGGRLADDTFWRLALIHKAWPAAIPHQLLWDLVSVPLVHPSGSVSWHKIRDLGELRMVSGPDGHFELRDQEGRAVGPSCELADWEKEGDEHPHLKWYMNSTVLLMSALDVRDGDGSPHLRPLPPSCSSAAPATYTSRSILGVGLLLIEYIGAARNALAVETPFPTANREHPLVSVYHQARYARKPTDLEMFARWFVHCIADTVSSKKATPSIETPQYRHKRVAHLYFSVQWGRYDSSLKAPYRLWTSERGWFDLTEDDLAEWRDCNAKAM